MWVTVAHGERPERGADAVEAPVAQFLARQHGVPPHRAVRRLVASGGSQSGWMQVATVYSPHGGFHYEVTDEGGSSYVRTKVLRALLDNERQLIGKGESGRAAFTPENYTFRADGLDPAGLATVLLSPRRKDPELIAGTLFLRPDTGDIVRLEGQLAKSPSFWIKRVRIVRTYDRVGGVVLPVLLESDAELRMFGRATLRMTYDYAEIDGRAVPPARQALATY
jgi:hypothetical protein